MQLVILYEHAVGYSLYKVKKFDEISMLLPEIEASVNDLARFNAIVKLISFQPFTTGIVALESINAISEGIVPQDLIAFLEANLSDGKKQKLTLGIAEPKLGAALSEALKISCLHTGAVPEILRGIRMHFHNLVKNLSKESCGVAQLGLGHSYSRAKVKFNVHRSDNMIIQSIALLDQLDKDINTFSMRIREWYSYHFPELIKIAPDNHMYAKLVMCIKDRKNLNDEKLDEIETITMDSEKAQSIINASKMSMGMDISPLDLINIEMFASKVIRLADYRKEMFEYLNTKMTSVAPNLQTLIGNQVGARLISKAGSLTNLAKYPASTVQILGAEKALFRALKTRGNTPKFGLLFHSSYIGRAGMKNKGRISRFLANKCVIASRVDCFSEQVNTAIGDALKQQMEDRLTFYETGAIPKKNQEVMEEAVTAGQTPKEKKKKKKKSKQNTEAMDVTNGD